MYSPSAHLVKRSKIMLLQDFLTADTEKTRLFVINVLPTAIQQNTEKKLKK
jgi:hypothetical protein